MFLIKNIPGKFIQVGYVGNGKMVFKQCAHNLSGNFRTLPFVGGGK